MHFGRRINRAHVMYTLRMQIRVARIKVSGLIDAFFLLERLTHGVCRGPVSITVLVVCLARRVAWTVDHR